MNYTCCVSYREIESTSLMAGSDLKEIHSSSAIGQHILFHFMCRWSCSRCWKSAMVLGRLSEELVSHKVSVVLVGKGRYLRPATRLAAKLGLPFTLIGDDTGADARALKRAYQLGRGDCASHHPAIVLVDTYGLIRFRQVGLKDGLIGKESELLSAIEALPTVNLKPAA